MTNEIDTSANSPSRNKPQRDTEKSNFRVLKILPHLQRFGQFESLKFTKPSDGTFLSFSELAKYNTVHCRYPLEITPDMPSIGNCIRVEYIGSKTYKPIFIEVRYRDGEGSTFYQKVPSECRSVAELHERRDIIYIIPVWNQDQTILKSIGIITKYHPWFNLRGTKGWKKSNAVKTNPTRYDHGEFSNKLKNTIGAPVVNDQCEELIRTILRIMEGGKP